MDRSTESDIDKILKEREQTHGSFEVHAYVTQRLKKVVYTSTKTSLDDVQIEALDMILHKIGRIVAGNPHYKDHWDDIAGYATLVSRNLERNVDESFIATASTKAK